ncbi:MAG: hypothetical protein JWQ95_5500 [Sphaerisporangium sp.]|jgi:hypothetical protein|nr:hypothetical protein [Sphaerisporangium sp.]
MPETYGIEEREVAAREMTPDRARRLSETQGDLRTARHDVRRDKAEGYARRT